MGRDREQDPRAEHLPHRRQRLAQPQPGLPVALEIGDDRERDARRPAGEDDRRQPLGREAPDAVYRGSEHRHQDIEQHLERQRPGHGEQRSLAPRHQVVEQQVVDRELPGARSLGAVDHDDGGQCHPVQGIDPQRPPQGVRPHVGKLPSCQQPVHERPGDHVAADREEQPDAGRGRDQQHVVPVLGLHRDGPAAQRVGVSGEHGQRRKGPEHIDVGDPAPDGPAAVNRHAGTSPSPGLARRAAARAGTSSADGRRAGGRRWPAARGTSRAPRRSA